MPKKYDASSIEVLKGLEPVRRRPKMYLCKCYKEESLDSLALEAACHALDEIVDNNCKKLVFIISDKYITVQYDYPMPIKIHSIGITTAEVIMTTLHAGCLTMKKHEEIGDEFCQVGMAVLNAVSVCCELKINSNGEQCFFRFEKGEKVLGPVFSKNNGPDSTTLMVKPDYELLENLRFSFEGISKKVAYLRERFSQAIISVVKGVGQ